MRRLGVCHTLSILLVSSCAWAAEPQSSGGSTIDRGAYVGGGPEATAPAMRRLQEGDPAPAFSYLDAEGRWHGFRQLFARGPVLLVFGARDTELKELERVQPVFADLGVRPVAVLDMGNGSAERYAQRLGLTCGVVSDPSRAIAELYGSLNPNTQHHAPSYFVLDVHQNVRAARYGMLPPARQMLAASARGLGRPLPESAMSMSRRE